jgi:N-acetylglucosamine-6-phosphate deacetylase
VALGHTLADGAAIDAAIAAGASVSTHLGHGLPALLSRHANPLWEQLARDELCASVIADGKHLTPAVLKCITRLKGLERLILTCDAGWCAGLPPGVYEGESGSVAVQADGTLTVPGTPYLAGSGVFLDHCVNTLTASTRLTLEDVVLTMMNGARAHFNRPRPRLEVGSTAAWLVFTRSDGEQMQCKQLFGAGVVTQ